MKFESNLEGALFWFEFGFKVIPLGAGSKITAVKWNPWLEKLSEQTIRDYWAKHPEHEVGHIVGNSLIVIDADAPEAVAALYQLEDSFDISPNLVIRTKKGEHHYFRMDQGTNAKSDSHSTLLYPERLDVKTGRALVVLPPSTGKSIEVMNDE